MKVSAFKQTGILWIVFPISMSMIGILIWARIMRPQDVPLVACIYLACVFLILGYLPIGNYLQAKHWEQEEEKKENPLTKE